MIKKLVLSVLVLITAFSLKSISAYADTTLWIGDSRSVGLAMGQGLEITSGAGGSAELIGDYEDYHFNAKCSQGLSYGKQVELTKDYDNIVVWLGINDLGNKKNYKDWLTDISESYNLYLVSVTQCSSPSSIPDESIVDFNNMLQGITNATYIDAYSLFEDEAPSYDGAGLHYKKADYQRVFDLVDSTINAEENKTPVLTYLKSYSIEYKQLQRRNFYSQYTNQ